MARKKFKQWYQTEYSEYKPEKNYIDIFEDIKDFSFITDEEYNHLKKYIKNTSYIKKGYFNEDCFVMAIYKALRWQDKFDPSKSSKNTWLYTIYNSNLLLENSGKYKNNMKRTVSLDDEILHFLRPYNGTTNNTFLGLLSQEDQEEIKDDNFEKIISIIENNKEFNLLNDRKNGITYIELAEKYGRNINTMKSRVFHQRKKLNELLNEM